METCSLCPAGSQLALHYSRDRGQGHPWHFLYPHPGMPLDLGIDGCYMLHLASVPSTAGPPTSCFVKNGPGFHQTLIGLHLAFPLPWPPHRMLAAGRSLVRPEQCWALAADLGLSRPANFMALSPHFAQQGWLPTRTVSVQGRFGGYPHTLTDHFGPIQTPPAPG